MCNILFIISMASVVLDDPTDYPHSACNIDCCDGQTHNANVDVMMLRSLSKAYPEFQHSLFRRANKNSKYTKYCLEEKSNKNQPHTDINRCELIALEKYFF